MAGVIDPYIEAMVAGLASRVALLETLVNSHISADASSDYPHPHQRINALEFAGKLRLDSALANPPNGHFLAADPTKPGGLTWTGVSGVGAYSAIIGDGSSTSITVTHSLGTREVLIMAWENVAPYAAVYPSIELPSVNTATFVFAAPPAVSSIKVLIARSFTSIYSTTVGDGTSTVIDVSHSFATRDIFVSVFDANSPWIQLYPEIELPSTSTVRLRFISPPAASSVRVNIGRGS